jgi:hypothetical protein
MIYVNDIRAPPCICEKLRQPSLVASLLREQRGRKHVILDRLKGGYEYRPLEAGSVFIRRVPVRRELPVVGLSPRDVYMRV